MRVRPGSRPRFVAWACVLAILLAVALSAAGVPAAILAAAGPSVDVPIATFDLCSSPKDPPPDPAVRRAVPARAPPLA